MFRKVERPTYDDGLNQQLSAAVDAKGDGDLSALLHGRDNWTVA